MSLLLADAGDFLLRKEGGDTSETSESGKASHHPRDTTVTTDPSRYQNGIDSLKLREKVESLKSYLSVIESAFSQKIKANEHLRYMNMEPCDTPDRYSDAEVDIDEFLREPMRKLLIHDNLLAKSLKVTCFSEVGSKPPLSNVNDHRHSMTQHFSQQIRVGAPLPSLEHQDDHHGPSTRLPDLRNRAANRLDHQPPQPVQQSTVQRCDGLLKKIRLVGKPLPERRSAQSALGYLDHHSPVGDLVKSPYAQRVRGSFTAYRMSKQYVHKSRAPQIVS